MNAESRYKAVIFDLGGTLRIALDEADITPADVLIDESRQASDFVDRVFDTELI